MVNKVDGNNYYVYTKQNKIDLPDTDEKFNLSYQKNESSSEAKDKKALSEQEKQQAAEKEGVRLELSVNAQDAGAGRQKQAEAEKAKAKSASGQVPLFETIRTYIMTAIAAVRDFFFNIWNDQPQSTQSSEDVLESAQLLEATMQEGMSDVQLQEGTSDVQLQEAAMQEGTSNAQLQEATMQEGMSDVQLLEGASQDAWLVEGIPQSAQSVQGASSKAAQTAEEIIDASDEISARALEEERRNRMIQQSLRNGDMNQVISLLTDNGRKTIAKNSTLLTSYDKNGRVVEPNASDRERALHGDKNSWKL